MDGYVTTRAAWASGPSALASRGPWGRRRRGTGGPARSRVRLWERRSIHRLAKTASPRRFGAFVYTVGPWAWVVGGLGIAIVYTNGRIGPLRAVLGHLCTLLGREGRASCNASCIGWHEHPNHHGVPAVPPGGRFSLGRENRLCATGSARVAPSPGWCLPETSTHINPRGALRRREKKLGKLKGIYAECDFQMAVL